MREEGQQFHKIADYVGNLGQVCEGVEKEGKEEAGAAVGTEINFCWMLPGSEVFGDCSLSWTSIEVEGKRLCFSLQRRVGRVPIALNVPPKKRVVLANAIFFGKVGS
jgi:hypothetical protein